MCWFKRRKRDSFAHLEQRDFQSEVKQVLEDSKVEVTVGKALFKCLDYHIQQSAYNSVMVS